MRGNLSLRNTPMYLALIATTLPIAVGYAFAVWVLALLLSSGRWRWLFAAAPETPVAMNASDSAFVAKTLEIMKPLTLGCLSLVIGHLVAALVGTQLSPWTKSLAGSLSEWTHAAAKYGLLWCTLSLGMMSAVIDGWNLRRAGQIMFVWMFFLFIYSIFQHWIGIDWVHGFGARLGTHRFAYGVYRVSGFMGHPLTFAYNIMLVTLAALAIAMGQDVEGESRGQKWWLGCALLGIAMLLISGSRFVLLVLGATLALCEGRRFWSHKGKVIASLFVVGAILWIEGSSLGRFNELLNNDQPLIQRFPRLLYWQLHWRMFIEHPVAGVSRSGLTEALKAYFSTIGQHDTVYEAHNLFLQYLADTGVIGFAGLVGWMAGLGLTWLRIPTSSFRGVSYLVVATFLSGLMQNNLRDSAFVFALWYLLSLLITNSIATSASCRELRPDDRKSTENFVARAHSTDPATGL